MIAKSFLHGCIVVAFLVVECMAVPAYHGRSDALTSRAATDKLVFAHFMIGIVSNRKSAADYDSDMKRAQAIGIDAFALNIGVDPFTDEQLGYAYQSAAANNMKVFISFDFNWYNTGQAAEIGQKVAKYASSPAQLNVDGKAFVSSFAGDGLDVDALRSAAGIPLFVAPNFRASNGDLGKVDAAFNWIAWDNNGNNKAPSPGANVSVSQGDQQYISALSGKAYIAPISPWFFTHYGPEVSYSKNWVFPSDLLWYNRWNEILQLSPQYIEIITWNDYGESHYIGPLSSPHYDDGGSKWANDMPHDGWLDLAIPYIAAFKASAKSVNDHIKTDQIIYWYRPNLKSLNCDATDTCMEPAPNASGNYFQGRPNGYETMADSIFVVTLLQSPGQLTVKSGGNSQTIEAPAGAAAFAVDMGVGQQSFVLSRNGVQVDELSGVSLRDVTDVCPCGLYNFNAFVGTLPAGAPDALLPEGLQSLTAGLHVTTCEAKPSLTSVAVAATNGVGFGNGVLAAAPPSATITAGPSA